MPLSEQEQRLLDEMERSLYHGDGDFVASVGRTRGGVNYTALVGGVLLALGGVGVLLAGVALHSWIVGVLGFAAMFAGVLIAVGNPGRRGPASARYAGPVRRRGRFMDRLAERWERRRQG
jgi:hypothetical protein